jgi:hypothetical protein
MWGVCHTGRWVERGTQINMIVMIFMMMYLGSAFLIEIDRLYWI